ncbi:MAG: M20/M25/M40 family metallo-hydrolase, partial [Planctomycetales bacterium]|nr:M20/M25/M40 family metallo-hydrolase [Planctomycetales bacterium]
MSPSEILYQLIAQPSVNPMGREDVSENFGEARMSDWLVAYFQSLGAPHERLEVLPGRDNVLARYDSPNPGAETILLDAHQDTVPVEGMTIPPFEPRTSEGRIYGRGSVDVKGSMAAMLDAFSRLWRERPAKAPNVVLSCSCDEEATAHGARALVSYWQPGANKSRLLAQPPSLAIVAEPTELDVVVAHRGVLRFRIRTQGRACHSSHPEQGKNAIYLMAQVIVRLQEQAAALASSTRVHPLCGGPRMSVCRIEGGSAVNIVPDHCRIEIDRRLIPGEDPQQVWEALRDSLSDLGEDVICEPAWIRVGALPDDNNAALAERLLQTVQGVV